MLPCLFNLYADYIVRISGLDEAGINILREISITSDMQMSHHSVADRWGKMETMTDFIFLGSKITVEGDCSHEIKRRLLLGRKAMTNLDSILKYRGIILLTKVHVVKAYVRMSCMDVRVR